MQVYMCSPASHLHLSFLFLGSRCVRANVCNWCWLLLLFTIYLMCFILHCCCYYFCSISCQKPKTTLKEMSMQTNKQENEKKFREKEINSFHIYTYFCLVFKGKLWFDAILFTMREQSTRLNTWNTNSIQSQFISFLIFSLTLSLVSRTLVHMF